MIKKLGGFSFLYSKVFIFVAAILVLSTGAFAYYTFSYDKEVTYEIKGSQRDLLVLIELTNQVLNVSQNLTNTQDLKLVNQNGVTNMIYLENFNITNLDPGNCTINGDVNFELRKDDDGLIINNSNFTMDAGVNNFNLTVIALNNRICPQNITVSLEFFEP